MFVETISQPEAEWRDWSAKLRFLTDPPKELVASIAWDSGDGRITSVNVWDAPGAVSDFFMERVLPLVEAEGEPAEKPQRHGEPVAVYVRP